MSLSNKVGYQIASETYLYQKYCLALVCTSPISTRHDTAAVQYPKKYISCLHIEIYSCPTCTHTRRKGRKMGLQGNTWYGLYIELPEVENYLSFNLFYFIFYKTPGTVSTQNYQWRSTRYIIILIQGHFKYIVYTEHRMVGFE